MRAVLGECLEAVSSELSFIALENAFELFGACRGRRVVCCAGLERSCAMRAPPLSPRGRAGMDLMIDEDWNVWLLEANAEPDFAQTGALAGRRAGSSATRINLGPSPHRRKTFPIDDCLLRHS